MNKKLHLLVAVLGLFGMSNANAQNIISQTGGGMPDDATLACTTQNAQQQATGMSDNLYYRAYPMSSNMNISAVNVGAYYVDYAPTLSGFPLTVTLYKCTGAFPGGTLTQLATASQSVPYSDFDANDDAIPKMVKVDFSSPVSVSSGDIIVAEVSMAQTLGAVFYIGAISGNETAPAYIKTVGCGVNSITSITSVDPTANGKIVIDLISDTPASSEEFFTENFTMYPNPVTDVLNIQSKKGLVGNEIRITDITGKVVKVQKDASSVNVSDLSSGTYLIDITTNEGKATSKFVKK